MHLRTTRWWRFRAFVVMAVLAIMASEESTARAAAAHPPRWRAGGSVGFAVSLPRSCDRCPSASGRGLTFGLELSAALTRSLALTLAGDARLLGYERRATSTLTDVSLSLQAWPSWGELSSGAHIWFRAGAAVASLATSLGDEINEDTGRVVQFRRLGPAAVVGTGYQFPHEGAWAFELSAKGIVAFLSDAPAVSLLLALGVMWH